MVGGRRPQLSKLNGTVKQTYEKFGIESPFSCGAAHVRNQNAKPSNALALKITSHVVLDAHVVTATMDKVEHYNICTHSIIF